MLAGEDGETEYATIVDISGRALDDYASHASHMSSQREVSAPAGGVDSGALLHHDHIAGLSGLDCGRAQVTRGGGPAFRGAHGHGENPPRDA